MGDNILYYIFSVVRIFLYPIALLYGAVVALRNLLYDAGFFSSVRFSVPVISIGNLSMGGTGKTPHVEYLVRLFEYRYPTATISRGYKRRSQGFIVADESANALKIGDEPMQYHMKFPELVVCVAEERMTGIPALLQRFPNTEVVVMDDAFQHRSVKAGFHILITDYAKPYYNDHILPFGGLREGRGAAKRADIIIMSKCPPNMTRAEADEIVRKLAPSPGQQVFFTGINYGTPYNFFTREEISLQGKNIVLVTGIAKPQPLQDYLSATAAGVHPLAYRDHHYFVTADIEEIHAAFKNWNVSDKIVATTEKDAARLMLLAGKLADLQMDIAVVPIVVNVLFGMQEALDTCILQYVDAAVVEHHAAFFGG